MMNTNIVTKEVMERAYNEFGYDFSKWYEYDFESEIEMNAEDLENGEFTEDDIECSKMDFIYCIINNFVEFVCNENNISTDTGISIENDKMLEKIYEDVKDALTEKIM